MIENQNSRERENMKIKEIFTQKSPSNVSVDDL